MGSKSPHRRRSHDRELELQFVYQGKEDPVVPTTLGDLVLADSRVVRVVDTYYDTASLGLRRGGCKLRVREIEGHSRPLLTWKGSSRRRKHGLKDRQEVEVPVEAAPRDGLELAGLLRRYRLWTLVTRVAGGGAADLREIGRLRTERSAHVYVNGLRRLELAWDRIEFPTGPGEVRLEVEVKSPAGVTHLGRARDRLLELFGDRLADPRRCKTRELCARLYPDLVR